MKTLGSSSKWQKAILRLVLRAVPLMVLLGITMLPACLRWQSGPVYLVKLLVIQLAAVSGGYLMLGRLYQNHWAVFCGVALYVINPWRYELCYVQNRLMLSLAWAALPWYLYLVLSLLQEKKAIEEPRREKRPDRWQLLSLVLLAALSLAAIGYVNPVMYCLIAALTVVMILLLPSARAGKVSVLLSLACSVVLWLSGNLDFLKYLFTDAVNEYGVPIQNITPRGYTFLDFLTTFTWQDGKPGLGIGISTAMAAYLYVRFVREQKVLSREGAVLGSAGLLSVLLATQYFPWELVQRLGGWALKFVSQIETPALFTGFTVLFLPAAAVSAITALLPEKKMR